jgi:flagellum-specific peptidoglycan hydrolase FlgJ
MTRVPPDQQKAFLAQVVPPAVAICPQYGLDPQQCIAEAAEWSSWGRFTIGYNWWGLGGSGDAGYYSLLRPVRTYGKEGGGWTSEKEQIAKFSDPFVAVRAWCEATGGAA